MENNKLTIQFGALADRIGKQLSKQNYHYDIQKVKGFDKSCNCIIQLWFDGILSDTEKKKCQDKLFKKITSHVNLKNR